MSGEKHIQTYEPSNHQIALEALTKKSMIDLLTAVGIPPETAEERRKSVMAFRLSNYVDRIKIQIEWDERMPKNPNIK
jgi:hypothetical protein